MTTTTNVHGSVGWFDSGSWRLDRRRMFAAAAVVAVAVAFAGESSGDEALFTWAAVLLVAETVLVCLPWRLPRRDRSGWGFCAESLVGLVAPVGFFLVVIVYQPDWMFALADPMWLTAGAVVGLGLLGLSGVNPRQVLNGELAFALGPTKRSHGRARSFAMAASPVGEEMIFRAPALLPSSGMSFALLAAVGFVGRHHVSPGTNRRDSSRAAVVELSGAVLLLALTWASGSLLPSLLAHLVNNLPMALVEMQREAE